MTMLTEGVRPFVHSGILLLDTPAYGRSTMQILMPDHERLGICCTKFQQKRDINQTKILMPLIPRNETDDHS